MNKLHKMRMRPRAMVVIAMLLFVAGFVQANDDWWSSKYLYDIPPEDRLDDSDSFISQAITESIKRYTDTITKLIIKYDPEDDWLIHYNDSTILDIQDIHDCFTFCDTMTFYINAQTLPPNYNFPKIDNVVYFTVSQDLVNLVEWKTDRLLDCLLERIKMDRDDCFHHFQPICCLFLSMNLSRGILKIIIDTHDYIYNYFYFDSLGHQWRRSMLESHKTDKIVFYNQAIYTYRLICDNDSHGKWIFEKEEIKWE